LAILGYPIANDKLYLDPEFRQFSIALSELNFDSDSDWSSLRNTFEKLSIDFRKELPSRLTGHHCSECGGALYGDPELEEREIWLHSRVYASATEDHASHWRYEAALPLWAQNF
jgi:tRNA pseudouridine synthase 8/2,5-diamino-6-(5-phospho-D-ribitylamino)-pyrimidin-4(3H)-one deaminase